MNTYHILGYTGEQNPALVNLLVEENGQTHKKMSQGDKYYVEN